MMLVSRVCWPKDLAAALHLLIQACVRPPGRREARSWHVVVVTIMKLPQHIVKARSTDIHVTVV